MKIAIPIIRNTVLDKKSAKIPLGIGAIVKCSSKITPATGSTAVAVSLNFSAISRFKAGVHLSKWIVQIVYILYKNLFINIIIAAAKN